MIKNPQLKNLKYRKKYFSKLAITLILAWLVSFNVDAQYTNPTQPSTPYFYDAAKGQFFGCGSTIEVQDGLTISDILFMNKGITSIGQVTVTVNPSMVPYVQIQHGEGGITRSTNGALIAYQDENRLEIQIKDIPNTPHGELIVPVCISFYYRTDNIGDDVIIKVLSQGDKSLEKPSPEAPAGKLIECCFNLKFPSNLPVSPSIRFYSNEGYVICGETISLESGRLLITDALWNSGSDDLLLFDPGSFDVDLGESGNFYSSWIYTEAGPFGQFGSHYVTDTRFKMNIQEKNDHYHELPETIVCCIKYNVARLSHDPRFGAGGQYQVLSPNDDPNDWGKYESNKQLVECCFSIIFPPRPFPVPAEVRPCAEYQSQTIITHQVVSVDPCEELFTVSGVGFDMTGATFEWFIPGPESESCGDSRDFKLSSNGTSPSKSLGTGKYYVKIRMSEGCSYCIPIEVSCTGTHQSDDPLLTTFPNPVDNGSVLTVNFNLNRSTFTSISFINETTYQQTYQYNCGELQVGEHSLPIQLPMMPAGNYFLFLNRDGEAPVYKHIFIQ